MIFVVSKELNVLPLAVQLPLHGSSQFRIRLLDQTDGVHHFIVHNILPLSISGESPGSLQATLLRARTELLSFIIAESCRIFNFHFDKRLAFFV